MFSKIKILVWVLSFVVPFCAPFPNQLLRHSFASGYGGCFDEPGLGWVLIYCSLVGTINGGIYLSTCVTLFCLRRKKALSVLFFSLALTLTMPLDFFNQNDYRTQYKRNHLIRQVGYYLTSWAFCKFDNAEDKPLPLGMPICIAPHTKIEIETADSNVAILSGKGLLRTYAWKGGCRSVTMIPEASATGPGLNYPHGLMTSHRKHWPPFDWKMHEGIARCCSIESVIDFRSEAEAINWIHQQQQEGIPFIYRNDGLFVFWSENIEPDTLWVIVHQLLIQGQKPRILPDAQDEKIKESKLGAISYSFPSDLPSHTPRKERRNLFMALSASLSLCL